MLVISFLIPDAGQHRGAFLAVATYSSWQRPFEWAAAWCSVKIILLAILLFLSIDAFTNICIRLKYYKLAFLLYCTESISILGLLVGVYYLLKALL